MNEPISTKYAKSVQDELKTQYDGSKYAQSLQVRHDNEYYAKLNDLKYEKEVLKRKEEKKQQLKQQNADQNDSLKHINTLKIRNVSDKLEFEI